MKTSTMDKFEKLNETFDIAEEALEEISVVLDDNNNLPEILHDEESDELLSSNLLRNDLKSIRFTILSNVQQGKKIIDRMTQEVLETGIVDAKLIDAVANMIKSTNASLKDMSSIFKELQEIEQSNKKKNPEVNGDINNTQNIFVGNASDLLDMLNKK